MNAEKRIQMLVKQAAYNYKISQNEYNDSKGICFRGKIRAYGDCVKMIREMNKNDE